MRFGIARVVTRWLLVVAMLQWGCQSRPRSVESRELERRVVTHYAELVLATYQDTVDAARDMEARVEALVSRPSELALLDAQKAWLRARNPYLQSEAFRFYEGPIDVLEMRINAWPVDEAYIDSIVSNLEMYPQLSSETLASLNEKEGEANISVGYHAVEYLLWGPDTEPKSAGNRLYTDFVSATPFGKRRGEYLRAASSLLTRDLETVSREWLPGNSSNYRARFLAQPSTQALGKMLQGLGQFTGAELLGERLTVPYQTKDSENEQSCFSDNTHNDFIYDLVGVQNVCLGGYLPSHGSPLKGPGLCAWLGQAEPRLAREVETSIQASLGAAHAILPPFDQAILGPDTAAGRRSVRATLDALTILRSKLEKASSLTGLGASAGRR